MDLAGLAVAQSLWQQGRLAEAEAACRSLLLADPSLGEAHYILGLIYASAGRIDSAEREYRRAVELKPLLAEALCNLGLLLRARGEASAAVELLQRAALARPESADVLSNLGIVLQEAGRLVESIAALRKAVELRPDFGEAFNNLGSSHHRNGQAGEALACYQKAAELLPNNGSVFCNLGNVLSKAGRLDEAIGWYERSLAVRPHNADVYSNLAIAHQACGRLDEALACHGRAMALRPSNPTPHSGRLYALHFHAASTPRSLLDEHRRWNQLHARPLASAMGPIARRPARERLRIGYVSPDFRQHVVGRFMQPLLENHDHARFEIICYSDVERPDALTAALASAADRWVNTRSLGDGDLASRMRHDQLDIAVDLTMHMGGSRLLAFARRAAPVQLTYLAYCSTTGLETMDYRLTDRWLDPPGSETFYTERSIRLPTCYWCYAPPTAAPPVAPPPAQKNGYVTFGCQNNFAKVSRFTIEMWIELLRRVGNSRLIVHSGEGRHRQEFVARFSERGIAPERISISGYLSAEDYFARYHEIDIALDPFPYGGGTTSCDALWMGVPVITRTGNTAVSRGGSSLLNALGLRAWVTDTAEGYVDAAERLAADAAGRVALRQTLRDRMLSSPLMDGQRFARDVEAIYSSIARPGVTP